MLNLINAIVALAAYLRTKSPLPRAPSSTFLALIGLGGKESGPCIGAMVLYPGVLGSIPNLFDVYPPNFCQATNNESH